MVALSYDTATESIAVTATSGGASSAAISGVRKVKCTLLVLGQQSKPVQPTLVVIKRNQRKVKSR